MYYFHFATDLKRQIIIIDLEQSITLNLFKEVLSNT